MLQVVWMLWRCKTERLWTVFRIETSLVNMPQDSEWSTWRSNRTDRNTDQLPHFLVFSYPLIYALTVIHSSLIIPRFALYTTKCDTVNQLRRDQIKRRAIRLNDNTLCASTAPRTVHVKGAKWFTPTEFALTRERRFCTTIDECCIENNDQLSSNHESKGKDLDKQFAEKKSSIWRRGWWLQVL